MSAPQAKKQGLTSGKKAIEYSWILPKAMKRKRWSGLAEREPAAGVSRWERCTVLASELPV